MAQISNLSAAAVIQQLDQLDRSIQLNSAERSDVLRALSSTLARVETPFERGVRLIFSQPALIATLKTCHDLNLFQKWAAKSPDAPLDASTLAKLVNADEELLGRLLRHLAATYVISLEGENLYSLTDFSKALGISKLGSFIPFMYSTSLPGYSHLPDYLRSISYQNPTDSNATNWHQLHGQSRFEILNKNPSDMDHFQNVMAMRSANNPAWPEIYPTAELVKDLKPNVPLVVDIGGGSGTDLQWFRKHNPGVGKEHLVLQDLKASIQNPLEHEGITALEHDFFKTEELKGARSYYLHMWPDKEATQILKNIAPAMEKGYSRVLIHEIVVPEDETPSTDATALDLHMMMIHNALERTESRWKSLIAEAGLKITKIWKSDTSSQCVIEADLA